jgi:hypothetical protein
VAVNHSHMNALCRLTGKRKKRHFGLAFRADRSDESSCAGEEERRENMPKRKSKDDNIADLAHGYARHVARTQGDHPLGSPAVTGCQNCGTTNGDIERNWTDDGSK